MFAMACSTLHAQQTETDIEKWQQTHPDVIFINQTDYANLSEDNLVLFGDRVIIYTEEIRWNDIEEYEIAHKPAGHSTKSYAIDEQDAQAIKTWLYKHRDVKVISNDYYQSLSTDKQQVYTATGAFVLSGNVLTLQDIDTYESTH